MQYRIEKKSGNKLSILGFGCMRFPRKFGSIDVNKSEELVLKAVQSGINYFDTAYLYNGSEETLGQIIHRNNLRDKIFIATKLPWMKCRSYADFDTLFNIQLERLRTDYIDYYLIHNLSDTKLWKSLCELGIEKWIEEKKKAGKIKQLGFSFHGKRDEFLELLDLYHWDFCQIQYNYINTNYQAGIAGLTKAGEMGLPVIIMEPLLGGKLANGLPKKALDIFKKANSQRTPAAWAFRWLWDKEEITVVLSGMNEAVQLQDNLETADNAVPNMLSEEEHKIFASVITIFNESYKIPCTGCNYCMPCPHNVNIPGCFSAYNVSYATGYISGLIQYLTSTGVIDSRKKYNAGQCKKCGTCEKKCPQHIPIIKSLEKVSKRMETFILKIIEKTWGKSRT